MSPAPVGARNTAARVYALAPELELGMLHFEHSGTRFAVNPIEKGASVGKLLFFPELLEIFRRQSNWAVNEAFQPRLSRGVFENSPIVQREILTLAARQPIFSP